ESLLAADECAEALVLLAAGGAAVEVGAQPGQRGVGVLAGELELYIPVEPGEALVAADLGCRRQERVQARDRLLAARAAEGAQPLARLFVERPRRVGESRRLHRSTTNRSRSGGGPARSSSIGA